MSGSARERVVAAALELFAEHGVSGTSLQMIADRLGVTKAAVYHQFPSKEEIVLAVAIPPLERLGAIMDDAERRRGRGAQVRAAVAGLVDLVVEHRRLSRVLSFDPVVIELVHRHPAMGTLDRVFRVLSGPDPSPAARVGVAMAGGGLLMAGSDPALAALDDDLLRRQLYLGACRALGVRPGQ